MTDASVRSGGSSHGQATVSSASGSRPVPTPHTPLLHHQHHHHRPASAAASMVAPTPQAAGGRHASATLTASSSSSSSTAYWSSSAVAAQRMRARIPRLGTAGWRAYVPRAWYRYLRPQDYLALLYLCYTLPLCFVAPATTGATPILFRLLMIPLYLFARPVSFVLPYPSTAPMGPVVVVAAPGGRAVAAAAAAAAAKPSVERDGLLAADDAHAPMTAGVYGDSACLDCCNRCCTRVLWVEADGCGCRRHAATGEYYAARNGGSGGGGGDGDDTPVPCCAMPRTGVLTLGCCGRGCTWYMWLCAYKLFSVFVVLMPWFIYPVGYGETGKFISALHPSTVTDQCQNDPIVQRYDDTLFGGQVSVTWRGTSTGVGHRLLAEYLQICYFGLYACVVGVPAALYWIAHHNRLKRAAAERDAHAVAAAAAAAATAAAGPSAVGDAAIVAAPESAAAAAVAVHGSPQPSPLTQSIAPPLPRTPIGSGGATVSSAATFGSPSFSGGGGGTATGGGGNGSFMAGTPRAAAGGGVDAAAATHTSRDTLVTVFGTPAPAPAVAASSSQAVIIDVAAAGTVNSGGGSTGNANHALSVQVRPATAAGLDGTPIADGDGGVPHDDDDGGGDNNNDDDSDEALALRYGHDDGGALLWHDEELRYDTALVTLVGVSMVCWIVYLCFPVAGPFWCFARPPNANVGFVFPYVLTYIQEQGAAHGTATPSSHCAVTCALWILCMVPRYGGKKLALSLAFIVPGLVVATVWLQYHYGFDAFVGVQMALVLAPLCMLMTTYVTRKLRLKRLPSVNLVVVVAPPPPRAAIASGAVASAPQL